MSKAKTLKTFSAMVKVTLDLNIDVKAETLADAVTQACQLTISDIEAAIPPTDCYNDYNISIQGVFQNE